MAIYRQRMLILRLNRPPSRLLVLVELADALLRLVLTVEHVNHVGIQLRYAVAFHDFSPNQRSLSVPVLGTCSANVKSLKLLNFRDRESLNGLSVLFFQISFG